MNKIICIGSSSKDIFFPTGDGIVTDTPKDITSQKKISFELGAKYQIDDRYEVPGGVAANTAIGLARLGIKTGCYSKVGDDKLGIWIIDELEKEGVGVDLFQVERNCKSDLSAIIVDTKSGDHTIFFNRDANEKLEVNSEKLKNTEWFFISALNGNARRGWMENMEEIVDIAKKENIRIALNPGQKNIKDNPNEVMKAIKNSEVLILNKDEAIEIVASYKKQLTGNGELNDERFLIKELQKLGPKIVALTDGMNGSWAYDGEKILHTEASKDRPVETTGAGDAFSSGFLAACLKGRNIEEALKWGSANGGNVVKFYGAKEGLLKENEIAEKTKNINIKEIV